ncbi:MAG: polysaccharide biosynthesis protein [Clostridia bacterium]|nr:polysaccharide biosynthesis protein [Clostridia bacterium]
MNPSAATKRPSFLSGVSILTLSALIVKVIGLLYRIPLLNYLGTEGMGYFNTAYELYALFCVISTAGLPVAMSVLISAYDAEGRRGDARRVYRVSLLLFAGIGLVGTALLWGLSEPFAGLLGNPLSATCMRAIAPTVLLICLSSAFRGYFQGRRNMLPTALSQVIEAGGKLFLGLAFAAYARGTGADLPTTAAYAVMGLTVGTALSVLYLLIHKRMTDRREIPGLLPAGEIAPASAAPILRPLLATAIPVTLSAGVISLTKCVDLALILRRLQAVGYTPAEANALYGCYSTLAVPVFNILPSLTTSIALSATPALSAALKKGKEGQAELRKTAASSMGLTLAVAIPAALGISVFAEDILSLLFAGQPAAAAQAAPWLYCLGLSVPAACLVTVTGAMLQAAGKANRPIISMLLGVGAKTVLAYVLLGLDGWGMAGAPFSSLVCDTVIVAVNLYFIARHAPTMLPDLRTGLSLFALPTLLAVASVGAVKLLRHLMGWQEITPLHTLGTVACVMCLYGAGLLLCLLLRKPLSIYKKKESQHDQVNQRSA